jgi:hypothetical protein
MAATEAEECRIPLDAPAAFVVHHVTGTSDGRQQEAQELKRDVFVLLRLRIVEAGVLIARGRNPQQRLAQHGVL